MNNSVFINGKIYTGNGSECEALAVAGNRVIETGSNKELKNKYPAFKISDLSGHRVLPAFTDSHLHFLAYSLKLQQVDLSGLTSLRQCLDAIASFLKNKKPGEWIIGQGWNYNLWPENRLPTRYDLDTIAPENPVCLESRDYHSTWVNTAALNKINAEPLHSKRYKGTVIADARGEPTGVFCEEARELIWKTIPQLTETQKIQALLAGMETAYSYGIASIHTMENLEDFGLYQSAVSKGFRLRTTVYLPVRNLEDIISSQIKSGFGNEWLRFGGIKIFIDGSLGSQTALMMDAYDNLPAGMKDYKGTEIINQKNLNEIVIKATENEIACAIHAIGDKANHMALNALQIARERYPAQSIKHRIEHAQLVADNDKKRFKDIIASVQPIHIREDIDSANKYWGKRCRNAYPLKSLLQSGARLIFGSDAPVETMDVFEGIYSAVRRSKRNHHTPWYPEESIAAHTAVMAYTVNPPLAVHGAEHLGTLVPDSYCDFVVLSDDILSGDTELIPKTVVIQLVIDGKTVFKK